MNPRLSKFLNPQKSVIHKVSEVEENHKAVRIADFAFTGAKKGPSRGLVSELIVVVKKAKAYGTHMLKFKKTIVGHICILTIIILKN